MGYGIDFDRIYSKKLYIYEIIYSIGIYHQKYYHPSLSNFNLDRDDNIYILGNRLWYEKGIRLKIVYMNIERIEDIKLKERK
jgi:hypothetical protein